MDIFKFINSQCIGEHLNKIRYKFSALEKAFLVHQSNKTTLQERHDAFREIIATEQDVKIEKRPNTQEYPSLFALLQRYMEIENAIIKEFYNSDQAVFRYRYLCGNDKSYCEDYRTVYPSLSECESAYKEDIEEYDYDIELRFFEFKMDSLKEIGKTIDIQFTPGGEIVSVFSTRLDEESSDVLSALDGMWFDFPTPFKRGDILIPKYKYTTIKVGTPIVITALGTWNVGDYLENGYTERNCNLKNRERIYHIHKTNGDSSDMTVCGYFACEDGSFFYEVESGLLDYEYYEGPFEGGYRILKVVSDFEKGELPIDLFVGLSRHIMESERLKKEKKYIHANESYLKDLGIM